MESTAVHCKEAEIRWSLSSFPTQTVLCFPCPKWPPWTPRGIPTLHWHCCVAGFWWVLKPQYGTILVPYILCDRPPQLEGARALIQRYDPNLFYIARGEREGWASDCQDPMSTISKWKKKKLERGLPRERTADVCSAGGDQHEPCPVLSYSYGSDSWMYYPTFMHLLTQ